MQYFFILGKNPALSVSEIESVLEQNIKDRELGRDFFIVDAEHELDPEKLQKALGGTIKIGKIINDNPSESIIIKVLRDQASDKKLNFAVNDYGCALKRPALINIKKKLVQAGIKSRLVGKEPRLSSVATQKQILDKQGIELNCFKTGHNSYLGQTMTCQPFEEFSQRDYGRPGRDQLSGMLPPKLAKIMINLAQADPKMTLLDPFVGSGTVLTEAAIMGYKNLIGTDINEQAIENTSENFKWLAQKGFIQDGAMKNIQVFQHDVLEIHNKLGPDSIDAIITEPYLGPPVKKSFSREDIEKIKNQLEPLYINAFHEFKKILKKHGKIVIIFPVFLLEPPIFMEILDKIIGLGFEIVNPLEKCGQNLDDQTSRHGILYQRAGQRVGREIFVFKKCS